MALEQDRYLVRLRWGLRTSAVVLGAALAWVAATQQSMNADGIAYLDMGDAYLRGDWSTAVNAVWSPLYAWILGSALHLLQPPLEWEFTVVHLVNFLLYVVALVCFEYFWRELTAVRDRDERGGGRTESVNLPAWAWLTLGYLIFIWTSLYLIEIWAVTPDMLVAALVYLAAALLLRKTWDTSRARFVAFGLVLGLGYLAKSAMFPLAFVFLVGALIGRRHLRRDLPKVLTSLVVFLIVAAPLVVAISASKGRFTFSDTGRLAYLKHVNYVPYPHWRPELMPGVEGPDHPARRISDRPAVFEFAEPVGGTYPLSYDPSYWYEGMTPSLDLEKQARTLIASGRYYVDLFLKKQGAFLAVVIVLLLMTPRSALRQGSARPRWALVGIALAAFGMYALVYAEGRYLGPFVALLWGSLLSFVRVDASPASRRALRLASRVLVIFAALGIGAFILDGMTRVVGWDAESWQPTLVVEQPRAAALRPVPFARALLELGLKPGDGIAYLGDSFDAFFARLARLRIIAEVPADQLDEFWRAPPEQRAEVLRRLRDIGATALVAEQIPPGADRTGWKRVADSRHFLYYLE